MKRKITNLLVGLLFLVGLGVLTYPTISNQWNTYRQSKLISTYEAAMEPMTPEDFSEEWEKARAFNASFTDNNLYGDVFGAEDTNLEDTEYWKVLNIAGDGVMGYLSIPKINIKLAIYHGTGEDVLQTGANDVYIIKKDGEDELLVPAIKDCVKNVDIEGGVMTLHLLEGLRDINKK